MEKTDNTEGQSFNEDELASIMSEIESLEKDIQGVQAAQESASEESPPGEGATQQETGSPSDVSEMEDELDEIDRELAELSAIDIAEPEEEASAGDSQAEDDGSGGAEHTEQEAVSATPKQDEIQEESTILAPDDSTLAELESVVSGDAESKSQDLQETIDEEVEEVIDELEGQEIDALVEQATEELDEVSLDESDDAFETNELAEEIDSVDIEDNVVPLHAKKRSSPAKTGLKFEVEGDLALNLEFTINGQTVALNVSEEGGFEMEMENGMKFTIPIDQLKASRAS